MSKRVWIATGCLILPLLNRGQEWLFRIRHPQLAAGDPDLFQAAMLNSLPGWLAEWYPLQVLLIRIGMLLLAAWIFTRQSDSRYLIPAVLTFIFAGWEIFMLWTMLQG